MRSVHSGLYKVFLSRTCVQASVKSIRTFVKVAKSVDLKNASIQILLLKNHLISFSDGQVGHQEASTSILIVSVDWPVGFPNPDFHPFSNS